MPPSPSDSAFVYFYGHRSGPHAALSNFYPASFELDPSTIPGAGVAGGARRYETAEKAIMHLKALLMKDEESAHRIINAKTPMEAKRLGRKVGPWDEATWVTHRGAVARSVVAAKFEQNPALAQRLRDTGTAHLAEAAPRDRIWGIGLSAKRARAGATWNGANLLGETLMAVRATL
jgi:ribA/ribD-fused uncharacterized protein